MEVVLLRLEARLAVITLLSAALAGLRAESSQDLKVDGVPVIIGVKKLLSVSVTGLNALDAGGRAARGGRETVGSDNEDPEKESNDIAGDPTAGRDSPGATKIVERDPSADVEVRSEWTDGRERIEGAERKEGVGDEARVDSAANVVARDKPSLNGESAHRAKT